MADTDKPIDGWGMVTCLLLDRPGIRGYRNLPRPSLDDLDADYDHRGGSSYYLSRRRKDISWQRRDAK